MKWKVLLLAAASLFERSHSDETVLEKLARYNISQTPLVGATPDFIADIPKKQRKKLRQTATAYVLKGLENPETFCQRLVAIRLSHCSKIKFRTKVATKELLNWKNSIDLGKFVYSPSKQKNTVLIRSPDRFPSLEAFICTYRHESIHGLIANDNLCHWDRTKNSNLTSAEKLLAPYDQATKAAFKEAITIGEERVVQLKNETKLFATPRGRLFHAKSKHLIDCFEDEAKAANTTLKQVLALYDEKTGVIKRQYEEYAKLYELIAAIFAVFANHPLLAGHLFPELRDILLQRIPEYKNCLDEIAPGRLSLTCHKTR